MIRAMAEYEAIRVHEAGAEPVLDRLEATPPGPGEIAVEIAACGVNFADLLMIEGKYQDTPPTPFTLGMELAGTVVATGDGVTGFAEGDRVAAFTGQGGMAGYGCFAAERAVKIPDAMPFEEAAGFLIAYGTSHLALTHRAKLSAGERLLVLGAAGGVGLTAVEIGAALGAEVVACARGPEKLKVAEAAGASHLIDSEREDIREAVRALGGADVVYDAVGGAQFEAALRATRPEARLLAIGFASGEVPKIPANHLLVKNVTVHGVYWGGYLRFAPEVVTDSLAALMAMYAEGRLHPHVSATYPIARAREALEMLRSRKSTGKVVVTM